MRVPICFLVALLGFPCALAQDAPRSAGKKAAPSRLPEPSSEEQKEAEKQIREIFAEEYAKRKPKGRRELAAKLLASARGTKGWTSPTASLPGITALAATCPSASRFLPSGSACQNGCKP